MILSLIISLVLGIYLIYISYKEITSKHICNFNRPILHKFEGQEPILLYHCQDLNCHCCIDPDYE